jgi:hypothetical protein
MADHDAFGRDRGEDPLAGMGWRTEPTPAPEATTVASPEPAGRRRRRGRGAVRMLISLVFLGAVVAGSSALVDRVGEGVDDILDAAKEHAQPPAAPVTPGGPASSARAPRGLQRRSLLREANLRAALRTLRGQGRLHMLRLAPDRIDAQLTTRRNLVLIDLPVGGSSRRSLTSPLPASAIRPIPFALVDAAAPARLARTAARRSHRSVTGVNYLVLMRLLGPPQWYLYFTDGVYYSADVHGRHARRLG